MPTKSHIQWTDATWNPTTGCTRVSKGCDNCDAFALHDRRYASNLKAAKAYAAHHASVTDLADTVGRDLIATVRYVTRGEALPFGKQYDLPFSRVQLLEDRIDWPLRHRKPMRIFVDSISDLFHEDLPDEFILRVFETMAAASWHIFQVLTKRPERMQRFIEGVLACEDDYEGPIANIWLGTSVGRRAKDVLCISHGQFI